MYAYKLVKTTLVWQHTQVQSRWSFFASSLTGYNSYMYTLYTTLRSRRYQVVANVRVMDTKI